jgi:hypothetical protein
LLEIERIAPALLIQRADDWIVDGLADQLGRLAPRQRSQLDPVKHPIAVVAIERCRHRRRQLTRSRREHHQHTGGRRAAQQRAHQLRRRVVSPMEVIEDEHQRLGRREPLKQLAHRPVDPIPLDLKCRATTNDKRGQGGKDLAELGAHVVVETMQPARLKASDVVVERVHEHPERQVALLLRPASSEHQHPVSLDAIPELRQQPGLPDPGRAEQLDRSGLRTLKTAESANEPIKLRDATYKMVSMVLHKSPRRA